MHVFNNAESTAWNGFHLVDSITSFYAYLIHAWICVYLFFFIIRNFQANMCYNFIFLYRECDSEVRLQSCDCNKKPFLSVLQYSSPSLITFFTFFLTEIHNFKVITLLWPFRENCCFAPGPTPILHPDLSNQPFPC